MSSSRSVVELQDTFAIVTSHKVIRVRVKWYTSNGSKQRYYSFFGAEMSALLEINVVKIRGKFNLSYMNI